MAEGLFDRYIAVDWSASSRPSTGADSIWIAEVDAVEPDPGLTNPPTRRAAERLLGSSIGRLGPERLLLAIDVGLGYPAGTAEALGAPGDPWLATWKWIARRLHDDDRNRNDRFDLAAEANERIGLGEGPFWGAPDGSRVPGLRRTKPSEPPLPEFRTTERMLRDQGWYPKSVWQLLGAGSVGGQTLTAIPVLLRLLEEFRGRVDVWPLTTGLRAPTIAPGGAVVAEIWPSRFVDETPLGVVRDAHQVRTVALALRTADRTGALADWFAPDVPTAERLGIGSEEGWVLGPPF